MPGPAELVTQIRQRLERLRRRLGDDGFDFGLPEDERRRSGRTGLALELDDADEADDEDEPVGDLAYDPDVAPDPAQWLALDESLRVANAEAYHRRAGVSLPNETIHAILHVMIETQIAMGDELPVRRAIDRLVREGLSRHEAIHALGSLITRGIYDAVNTPEARAFRVEEYNAAVEQITAESWRRQWEEDEE